MLSVLNNQALVKTLKLASHFNIISEKKAVAFSRVEALIRINMVY